MPRRFRVLRRSLRASFTGQFDDPFVLGFNSVINPTDPRGNDRKR
jgi:hypothetical protein